MLDLKFGIRESKYETFLLDSNIGIESTCTSPNVNRFITDLTLYQHFLHSQNLTVL